MPISAICKNNVQNVGSSATAKATTLQTNGQIGQNVFRNKEKKHSKDDRKQQIFQVVSWNRVAPPVMKIEVRTARAFAPAILATGGPWIFGSWRVYLDQCNMYVISKWGFPQMGVPQNGWFMMENAIEMDDDWGYPYFRKPANMYYPLFFCQKLYNIKICTIG